MNKLQIGLRINKLLEESIDADINNFRTELKSLAESIMTDSLVVAPPAAATCAFCNECSLAGPIVYGKGTTSAQIMIVGLSPDDNDVRMMEPFTGEKRILLDKILTAAQKSFSRKLWDIDNIYLTYAVKCQAEQSGPIEKCKHNLQAELELVKPQLLICFSSDLQLGSSLLHPNFTEAEYGVLYSNNLNYRTMVLPGLEPVLQAIKDGDRSTETKLKNIIWKGIKKASYFLQKETQR